MPTKIITLEDHFATGEPTVQLISTRGRGGRILREATSLHKIASLKSPALDYIKSIEPEEGKSVVLVVGLGDHETYGPNRNGDGFPSQPIPGKIAADEVLTKHYQSYKNAHVFEHHVNQDPAKAIGRVKAAFWNPFMRRVEVVEDFDHAKAPHLLEKIGSGEYPAKSMGCRIKYDVCTKCANKARTRAEYCDHLKFAMSQIDPETGEQNAALNPSPDFFDSSWVVRPADRGGYMLKKVAAELPYEIRTPSIELGALRDEIVFKAANIAKAADIEKIIKGEPAASVSNLSEDDARLVERYNDECGPVEEAKEKPSTNKIVRMMITYKPSEAIDTAHNTDFPMGLQDLLSLFFNKLKGNNEPEELDENVCKCANAHLPFIYDVFTAYPRFLDSVTKLAFAPSTATESYLSREILPTSMRGRERPLTDTMEWTDPRTGKTYVTNYGTVQRTNDALVQQGLKRKGIDSAALLGGGSLLGAAALGMGKSKTLKGLPRTATGIASLGTIGAGLYKAFSPNRTQGPLIRTNRGDHISGWTEMAPKTASQVYYLKSRYRDPKTAPISKTASALLWQQIKQAEVHDDLTPLLGPTLNIDQVAEALGTAILKGA